MRWIARPSLLAGLLLGLISLYTVVGFLLLPHLIKDYLLSAALDRFKHPIVVREVALNPFALSAIEWAGSVRARPDACPDI